MNENQIKNPLPWYRRRPVIILIILIILALIAAGALYWYLSKRGYVSTDDAAVEAERVAISSQIQGRIRILKFNESDSVSNGDTLVLLDDSMFLAQLQVARSGVEAALRDSSRALVSLNGAQEDLRRGQIQYRNGIIPKERYDHLKQAAQAANDQYQIAIAKLHSAEAQLTVAETNLGYAIIVAQSSGRIARRWVAVGDVVVPGQSIYTMYQTGQPWVTANFEETKIAAITPGDKTSIHVDAFGDRRFEGEVLWIGAATASEFSLLPSSNVSGNFTKVTQRVPCRISIHEVLPKGRISNAKLVPGLSAEVSVRVRP